MLLWFKGRRWHIFWRRYKKETWLKTDLSAANASTSYTYASATSAIKCIACKWVKQLTLPTRTKTGRTIFTNSVKVMLHGTIYNDDFQGNTALQCWNNVAAVKRQCCNNVPTLRCAKTRRWELSRVTSPYKSLLVGRVVYFFILWEISNPYPPQLDVERNDKTLSLDISTLLTVSANTQQLVASFLYFRTTQMLLETILQKSTFNLGRIQQRFLFH